MPTGARILRWRPLNCPSTIITSQGEDLALRTTMAGETTHLLAISGACSMRRTGSGTTSSSARTSSSRSASRGAGRRIQDVGSGLLRSRSADVRRKNAAG